MQRCDSGVLTDAEFTALTAKLILGQARALTRGGRCSVPAVVYRLDSRDHPETTPPAFDQVVDVDYSQFDARVDQKWAREKRYAGAPIDAELEALLRG